MMCFFASLPTTTAPSSRNVTTDACVRSPHSLAITFGTPSSTMATQLLLVPRSMPMAICFMDASIREAAPRRQSPRVGTRCGNAHDRDRNQADRPVPCYVFIMVGTRSVGLVCNDPQRAQIALFELAPILSLPAAADAIGIASLVDG